MLFKAPKNGFTLGESPNNRFADKFNRNDSPRRNSPEKFYNKIRPVSPPKVVNMQFNYGDKDKKQ